MCVNEIWKDIDGFEGYQVSNRGAVRSFWKRRHYPTGYGAYWYISDEWHYISASDDGNGYLKVMLYNRENGRRYCKKVHRLVAEAFIPHDSRDDTVDHIQSGREGKLDNSVDNLRWISRAENIRKAYRDGMCDERIRSQQKDILVTDTWTGNMAYFSSIREASDELGINYTSIVHALNDKPNWLLGGRYQVEYSDWEGRLLYGDDDNKLISWLHFGLR